MLQIENLLINKIELLDKRFYATFNNEGIEVRKYRIDLTSDEDLLDLFNKVKDLSPNHNVKIVGRKYKKIVFKRG